MSTLVKLAGRGLRPLGEISDRPFIGRLATNPIDERDIGLDVTKPGLRAYLLRGNDQAPGRDAFRLGTDFHYLAAGDVVRIDPQRRTIQALYRRSSPFNALLVTERCDNYCIMCSQPPKEADDSYLVDELRQAIPLMAADTPEIGITGGEPTTLGARLPELIGLLRTHLPNTPVHVLSNGRNFSKTDLPRMLADVGHPDLMIGIPLYSSLPEVHDFVVQARGAYDETIRGILRLKEHGIRVEIRFVIHQETYAGLPEFARFVARNLRFVDHVALMGLELMGFARANVEGLWIDPLDYQRELRIAAHQLDRTGIRTSVYNHQLCVLHPSLHKFARASISDWKNAFLDECRDCALHGTCGGFFASGTMRPSRGIKRVVG